MIEERAVTDIAMTIVRRLSPGQADVVLFTQGDEASTGADFELLVFDSAGKYIAYLVQAKAMKAGGAKEGYPALGERDGAVMQFDKLLAACGPGGPWAGHGALHLFYNGELLQSAAIWPTDRCVHASAADQAARGITVAPTTDIAAALDAGRRSYRYDRIAPESGLGGVSSAATGRASKTSLPAAQEAVEARLGFLMEAPIGRVAAPAVPWSATLTTRPGTCT